MQAENSALYKEAEISREKLAEAEGTKLRCDELGSKLEAEKMEAADLRAALEGERSEKMRLEKRLREAEEQGSEYRRRVEAMEAHQERVRMSQLSEWTRISDTDAALERVTECSFDGFADLWAGQKRC